MTEFQYIFVFFFLGWSVTVAGTYQDDMAPDVEMRLCFPKKSPKTDDGDTDQQYRQKINDMNCITNFNNHHTNGTYHRQYSDISNENYSTGRNGNTSAGGGAAATSALTAPPPPPSSSSNLNPKRTLSKSIPGKENIYLYFNEK